MEVKTLAMALLAFAVLGCGSGGNSAPAPAGPQDLAKLTPQQQLEKVQNDPSIPPQIKQTAINSIKQKYGLK